MANVKASRADLKKWRDHLKVFSEFLPILQLKKQQLQSEVRRAAHALDAVCEEAKRLHAEISPWVILFSEKIGLDLSSLIKVEKVTVRKGNIAGIRISFFEGVEFSDVTFSLLTTPSWVDSALELLRKLATLKAKEELLKIQLNLLKIELRKTSQRVNLFEKIKIPEAKDSIRIIKILLGDEQTAAVCRSKIAKTKNSQREVS